MPPVTNLIDQLKRDEGCKLVPYRDSVGKLTIGIGRNLDDVGISVEEAEHLLANDIAKAEAALVQHLPWTARLDRIRHAALVNMAFNMGIGGLCQFARMLAALQAGDYATAVAEMAQSKWARQVGIRAQRLAAQIRTGEWQ